jgi:hypothetical protein
MKRIISILSGIALLVFGMYSCKKSNINGDSKDLILGSYITLEKVTNENLNFSDPAATVSIDVKEFGSPVASVNIYLATGSNTFDPTGWKLIKNVPYSGTTTLTVSTADIAAALAPNTIVPGNTYTLQNEVVTKDGRKFSNANTPTSYQSFPSYNMALNWSATAVCAFDATASAGTYKVVKDAWADYNVGDLITVTAGPGANQLSFLTYPSTVIGGSKDNKPTVVDVDAATGAATIAKQATGTYYTGTSGQTNTQVAGSGFVFSCTGSINLTIDITYGTDLYPGYNLVLQKQ